MMHSSIFVSIDGWWHADGNEKSVGDLTLSVTRQKWAAGSRCQIQGPALAAVALAIRLQGYNGTACDSFRRHLSLCHYSSAFNLRLTFHIPKIPRDRSIRNRHHII
jgi:hypothetical protein